MKVISIDPGYERLGIAVISKDFKGKEELIFSETFKTSPADEFTERLLQLGNRLDQLIIKYNPDAFAIENLFMSNNQKTAMNVSEARGALLYVAKKHNLEIAEFTPLQIKTAVAGHGRADKKAVIDMTQKLIKIPKGKRHDDEYDAIACGLTFFAYYKRPV